MWEANKGTIVAENETYTDEEGNIAIIPAGFCVVVDSDPISQGLVISDVENDDMNNSKGGNQFVWIPVDGTNLKYERHIYATTSVDDSLGSTADTGNGNWPTYQYRCHSIWTEWTDSGINPTSVDQYKGFYIGRFEAGMPSNAPFYNNTDGSIYWQSNNINDTFGSNSLSTGSYSNTYMSKDTTNYIPVSKKNNPSWNFISQTNAKAAASKMYEGSSSVTSSLIDSYAWDTVTQWLSNSGINVIASTSWGNYISASFTINGLYAKHEYKRDIVDTYRCFPAYRWNKGTYTKNSDIMIETATGSVERNKANNIYDFAGNMWEWTTEIRIDNTSSKTFAVVRGGSFERYSDNPASIRRGYYTAGTTETDTGFRIVLYIK